MRPNFPAFLDVRSGLKVVIVDGVNAAGQIKVSSQVGMQLPLLAAAGGKALLSQPPGSELDRMVSEKN